MRQVLRRFRRKRGLMKLSRAEEVVLWVWTVVSLIMLTASIAKLYERIEETKHEVITNESNTMHDSRAVL